MLKKIFLFTIFLFLLKETYPQTKPFSFNLEKNTLLKSSAENPVSNSINDIITVGDTVWIGTSRGLSKSTDNGENWTNYYHNEAFGSEGIFSFDYKNGIICVATGHSTETSNGELPEGSGIRLSTDQGTTWISLPQSVDDNSDSVINYGINRIRALPITTGINNVSYDIAITSNYVWTASFAGGLRRISIESVLNETNPKWERIVLPPDHLNEIKPTDTLKFSLQPVAGNFGSEDYLNHRVFSVMAVNDSLIYAGSANGINISADGGSSWRKVNHQNQENAISGNWVVGFGYNNITNSVWAVTWRAEEQDEMNAVSFTTDGGASWDVALDNEKAYNFGFKNAEIMVPTDNGVFRSDNMGRSWILPGSIIDAETKLTLKAHAFYAASSHGNFIWLGSDNGLARLNESTQMWTGEWKVFIASTQLTTESETYAFPNPFSPDIENVKIKYSTGGKRQNVTIRIFDFGMNLVKTIIQNTERGVPVHSVDNSSTSSNGVIDYWDGRDESGSFVPNGVYFYRIDFDSGEPVFGKIMVLM